MVPWGTIGQCRTLGQFPYQIVGFKIFVVNAVDNFRFQHKSHIFLLEIHREPGNYYWDRLGNPWEPKKMNREARDYFSNS